jgi:uncharacterized RDD family membrane protein YckC
MDPQQPAEPNQPANEPPTPAPAPDAAAAPVPAAPSQPPAGPPPAAPQAASGPASAPMAPAPTAWQPAPPVSEPGPGPGVGYAPHAGRLIAYLVDGFIIGIIVTIVAVALTPFLVAGASTENSGATAGAVFIYVFIVLLISVGYFPFFWARSGQTPGMRIFALRVVRDADGGKISGGTAIIRLIGLWISFAIFYLGIIWILVDNRRRGWHDLLAGTVVVHEAA